MNNGTVYIKYTLNYFDVKFVAAVTVLLIFFSSIKKQ